MTPRCPSPVDLERAFWCDDAELRAHALTCPRCAPAWAEIAALVEAGRELEPAPSSPQRREELRTTILATLQPGAPSPAVRHPRWVWLAPLAAAAAILLLWWAGAGAGAGAPAEAHRGHVLEHPGARYQRAGTGTDEIVRLIEGTLSVQVDRLPPDARFRVITGDAEVEVRGTAFDVTAAADRLVAVRVLEGEVEVRSAGQIRRLVAGETWRAELLADAPAPAPDPASPAVATAPASTAPASTAPASTAPARRRRVAPVADPRLGDASDAHPVAPVDAAAPPRAFDEGFEAIRRGDYDQAAAAFARAVAAGDPGIAEDAAYWRAIALARAGRPGGAIAAFESFLAEHPDAARAGEASVMLGWLLLDRSDLAGAGRRFRSAARDRSARIRRSAAEGLRAVEAAGADPG